MAREKFSRHVNDQYRWTEDAIRALRDLESSARHFKMTQADHIDRRSKILAARDGQLTRESRGYVRGYMRAQWDALSREMIHVRRISGRPETATSAKWDDMTEEMRAECRKSSAERRTESCLAWDDAGAHPYSQWTKE